jgi:hypothetical protein
MLWARDDAIASLTHQRKRPLLPLFLLAFPTNKKARRFPPRLFDDPRRVINASRTVVVDELCDDRISYAQPHENLV